MKQNVALLVDADNISSKYIKTIIDELTSNYGVISIKRVYGDWTTDTLKPWKDIMLEYSLTPIQQFAYRSGKNSTDSAMIIDAMDILYTKEITCFCLATSDCDFTKIASRLRESGKTVIGMGESKTHKSFISACNEFKYIDVLLNNDDSSIQINNGTSKSVSNITPFDDIRNCIADSINSADGKVQLGGLKNIIISKYSDFDERNYGYSKFSTFISSFSDFSIDNSNNANYVYSHGEKISDIQNFLIKTISDGKKKCYTSAEIQNLIAKQFKNFRLKNYGYSNMKSFLNSIVGLSIDKQGKYSLKLKVK